MKKNCKKGKNAFLKVLDFIEKTFPERGFRKFQNSQQTSRPYFEALSVGALLSLRENSKIVVTNTKWSRLDKKNPNEFFTLLSGKYHTHTPTKLRERIEFVKQKFLS